MPDVPATRYYSVIAHAEKFSGQGSRSIAPFSDGVVKVEINSYGGIVITVTKGYDKLYDGLCAFAFAKVRSRTGHITQLPGDFGNRKIVYLANE